MKNTLQYYKNNLIKIQKAFENRTKSNWYLKEKEMYKSMIPLVTQDNFDNYIQFLRDYENSKKYVLDEYERKGLTSFVFWNFTYYVAEGTNIKGWFGLIHYRISKIKYPSEWKKQEVENAIKNDEELSISWVGKYDYSIKVKQNEGFYNREYHGCGNGYYYVLLNAKEALFIEKD